jgi:hypothetical protein
VRGDLSDLNSSYPTEIWALALGFLIFKGDFCNTHSQEFDQYRIETRDESIEFPKHGGQ